MYKKIIFVLITVTMLCGSVSAVQISDLGNGVYFFNGYPDMFGHDLSQFLTDHPQLRVVSIASYDNGYHGYTSGYYVVFENKIPNYMTCYPNTSTYQHNWGVTNYNCILV